MTKIALYDLDRTITKRPTYLPFLLHAAWRHEPLRLLFAPAIFFLVGLYIFRVLDRAGLKERMHDMMLGAPIDPEKMASIAESFATKTLAANVHPQAIDRIRKDKASGHRLVVATASYAFYVLPLARRLGFDDLIGTEVKRDEDGGILAEIDGKNCYGPEKLHRVEAWAEAQGLDKDDIEVRFYSDSPTDLPVFEWADEAIVANPTSKMRKIADQRGWQIFAWG